MTGLALGLVAAPFISALLLLLRTAARTIRNHTRRTR